MMIQLKLWVEARIAKAVKALQKPGAAAALVIGLVLMYYPSCACFGGKSFSSSRSSSSYSDDEPDVVIVKLVFLCFMFWMLLKISEGNEKTSVLKLQVGLLGLVRSLQKDLNRIAETADTSTPEGLHYVLTETVRALLQHPDYFISAYSSVEVKSSRKEGEKRFNQLSIEERRKFDEETLVNVNGIKKQSSTSIRAGGISNEYIVLTILVAAKGILKLPTINNSNDLKQALLKLPSIPSGRKKGCGLHKKKATLYQNNNSLPITPFYGLCKRWKVSC